MRRVAVGQVAGKGFHDVVVIAFAADAQPLAQGLILQQHVVGHLEETVHPVAMGADDVHRHVEARAQRLQVLGEQLVDGRHGGLHGCR